ncbi:MAG: ATP-dependent helicase [Bacteroidia bacterium]|nr:ATP-dependent helicase [Bacteroidia bacterium]
MISWDEGLFDDQKEAASHIGDHARLLAGPGTGKTKTLSRRIAYLITEKHIPPNQILALTFTRVAASELRNRVSEILEGEYEIPRISTLHSFALRQLLKNSRIIDSVPQPLRIADSWEEYKIIFEDLKKIANYNLKTIEHKINLLSADWETLKADESGWKENFPDPTFLGAWQQHRKVFGYTLRSEMVYQLKRALEQSGNFALESDYKYLLIDEFQDLNKCDLAVIFALKNRGVEVFVAGDDDQSIYGFRGAYPDGIRRFNKDYIPSSSLTLKTCFRCDRNIIFLSSFVADLDPGRLKKSLEPLNDAEKGVVRIFRYRNQEYEAADVANICRNLLDKTKYEPKDILILMRSDRKKAFSSIIRRALEARKIRVAVRSGITPLDNDDGRVLLAVLRLIIDNKDSLALRTLLRLQRNGVGEESCSKIYNLACENGKTFSMIAYETMEEPELIPHLGRKIANEMHKIQDILNNCKEYFNNLSNSSSQNDLLNALYILAKDIIKDDGKRAEILQFLQQIIVETNSTDHLKLISMLSSSLEDKEQELDLSSVNIMTMHKAKGLEAKAVIIIAAEDEYIPGTEPEDDERRLLYVSLSRAQHVLIITYCDNRIGSQKYTGRTRGKTVRTLSRFLRGAPIKPISR